MSMTERIIDASRNLEIVSDLQNLTIDVVSNEQLHEETKAGESFLLILCDKVKQLKDVSIVGCEAQKLLLYFSIQIPKIYSHTLEFPNKVIKLIDDTVFIYFFKEKPKNLSSLNWCSKYLLHSFFRKEKQVNTLQFYWFKKRVRGEDCSCFICKSYHMETSETER